MNTLVAQPRTRVVILGAAGRDFHNFNVIFRDNELYEVVAFTAAQIPNISGRKYPAALAGKLYPRGIPIYEEKDLEELIKKYGPYPGGTGVLFDSRFVALHRKDAK